MNNIKISHSYRNLFINICIIMSFLVISFLSVILMLKAHIIEGAWDLPFHWGRIYELVQSFHHGVIFPHFNINAMSSNGTAIMLLYPYITILPFIFVLTFFKFTISIYYIFFAFIYLIGLLISFYSSKSISKNKFTSYVFSILYCTSSIFVTFSFTNMDVGALLSFTYMPLVIFGFVHFIKDSHWIEMAMGIILLIFTHVLSVILVILFMTVWFLVDIRKICHSKRKLINFSKAILTVVLITAFIWIPAIYFLLTNTIKQPINFGMPSSLDILSLIYTSFTNNVTMSWGLSLFGVLGFVFTPLIFYKRFSPLIKKLYWLSFSFAIFSTGLFPWEQSLSKTPLHIIQFPWRLDTVPQMLFIFILSTCITKYIKNKFKYFYGIIALLVSIVCQLACQQQEINLATRKDSYELTRPMFKNDDYNKHYNAKKNEPFLNYHISRNSDLKNALDTSFPVNDYPDYYPVQSFIDRENLSKDLGSYTLHTKYLKPVHNGRFELIKANRNDIKGFELPFVSYNHIHYRVYANHQLLKYKKSNTHLITISKLPKNTKYIQVKILHNKLSYLYDVISIVGLLYLITELYNSRYNN